MMTARQQQIIGAMTGRQASQVNDNALYDAVRSKLVELGTNSGHPLTTTALPGIVAAVLRAAAKTICFEAEIPLALEMGAAGELEHESTHINQSNAAKWVTAYACSGDRRAAQNWISIQAARDRARTDAVASSELRDAFEREGLRTAWREFLDTGTWDFRPGYAAVIYKLIGTGAIRSLLTSDQIAGAKTAARAALRRDDPRRYRTMPDDDMEVRPVFGMYWKAQLCRAYFEELRTRSLDIDWQTSNTTAV